MTSPVVPALLVGVATAVALLAGSLFVPFEVRNSAPYGFSLTVDFERAIAVRGGPIEVNYPNLNRLDLDLRVYTSRAEYDVIVHLRSDESDEEDVRTIALHVPGTRIWHDKSAFANPFVTVRFPPIADSAGERYYVYVETGPRNRDDVLALWSIKSYSRVSGQTVLSAFVASNIGNGEDAVARSLTVGLLLLFVVGCGWLMGAATWLGFANRPERPPGDPRRRRWWRAPAVDGIQ